MVFSLFPPVSARVLALVEALEPARLSGATFSPSAAADLARELATLAADTSALEAVAAETEAASRRLFALAGAVEKHAETGFWLPRPEALALTAALRRVAVALGPIESAFPGMAAAVAAERDEPSWYAPLSPPEIRAAADHMEARRARWLEAQRDAAAVGLR